MRPLLLLLLALLFAAPAGAQPAAPAGLVSRSGETEVVLHWDPVAGATGGYRVYRAPAGGAPSLVGTAPTNHFVDTTTVSGEAYAYTVRAVGNGGLEGGASGAASAQARPLTDAEFLDLVERLAVDYFWYEANPANGHVRDRSQPGSPSSIAAVGFGLSALVVAAERGWIDRAAVVARVRTTLQTLWNAPQGTSTAGTAGYKGLFYHFLDMGTGLRTWDSELSTIDTALLMAGVLHAGAYFTGASAAETDIRTLSDQLYRRVDWRWSQAGGSGIRLGWKPGSGAGTGFLPYTWVGYNEAMILYLLAYGSPEPTRAALADWSIWTQGYDWETHYGYSFVVFPPLFGHQYSHAWIDFRGIQDFYMSQRGIDYFENSRRATLAQREYHIANPAGHPNYGPDEWGLTASDCPSNGVNDGCEGYGARGAPPAMNDDGTIAPTAPGGSIAFTPTESTAALRRMYTLYAPTLWGPYGFRDAYNVRYGWTAQDYLGIDQGPFVLMIENLRSEAVWDVFMTIPAVQLGLERAGFEAVSTAGEAGPAAASFALTAAPNPVGDRAEVRFRLDRPAHVRLSVYDALGREVAVLVDGARPAGPGTAAWAAAGLAPGRYLVRLQADGRVATLPLTKRR